MSDLPRPLCTAENNTCKNLAEKKGKLRSGKQRYGRYCDSHRRRGHKSVTKRSDRRYVPLDGCVMCVHARATDRHRIIQGGLYAESNLITLCRPCHENVHRFYEHIRAKGLDVVYLSCDIKEDNSHG